MPDVVTTSKGLGNGVPIGACLSAGRATNILQPGNHGSTFGGNPLACGAALATVETICSEHLLQRATIIGERIINSLRSQLSHCKHVQEIRGLGCMIGIQLDRPCKSLFAQAMDNGLIINITADSVIRLLPPLILSDEEADEIVSILVPLVDQFTQD
jgi:acetylornithine aminotransferase